MKIQYSRAMLTAALNGDLDDVNFTEDPIFKLFIPASVPGVPAEVLTPRNTWADKGAYDETAKKLAQMFVDNFKQYEDQASADIVACNPNV
jgi:phosphoenolpyruvate carboxykinase (ATP)